MPDSYYARGWAKIKEFDFKEMCSKLEDVKGVPNEDPIYLVGQLGRDTALYGRVG
jgi:hypothetical protein